MLCDSDRGSEEGLQDRKESDREEDTLPEHALRRCLGRAVRPVDARSVQQRVASETVGKGRRRRAAQEQGCNVQRQWPATEYVTGRTSTPVDTICLLAPAKRCIQLLM